MFELLFALLNLEVLLVIEFMETFEFSKYFGFETRLGQSGVFFVKEGSNFQLKLLVDWDGWGLLRKALIHANLLLTIIRY